MYGNKKNMNMRIREGSEFTGRGGRRFVLFGAEKKPRPPPAGGQKFYLAPPSMIFQLEKYKVLKPL